MILDFRIIADVFPALVVATHVTLSLSVFILALGLLLGLPMGLMATARNRPLSWIAETYILIFRGTPPLVQLFVIYFGLAQFEAVRNSVFWPILRDAYWCAVIALGLNSAAYVGRMFGGALRAVPPGQTEAAQALGMSRLATLLTVRAPQAFRIMLPAYGNEVVMTLKATALASTITVQDLMGRARAAVNDTYAPYEVLISAAIIYLALTYGIGKVFGWLEHRLNPVRGAKAAADPAPDLPTELR